MLEGARDLERPPADSSLAAVPLFGGRVQSIISASSTSFVAGGSVFHRARQRGCRPRRSARGRWAMFRAGPKRPQYDAEQQHNPRGKAPDDRRPGQAPLDTARGTCPGRRLARPPCRRCSPHSAALLALRQRGSAPFLSVAPLSSRAFSAPRFRQSCVRRSGRPAHRAQCRSGRQPGHRPSPAPGSR